MNFLETAYQNKALKIAKVEAFFITTELSLLIAGKF